MAKRHLLLLFQVLFSVDAKTITVDQNTGLIIEHDPKAILTVGQEFITLNIGIKIPEITIHQGCNLYEKLHSEIIEQYGLQNSTVLFNGKPFNSLGHTQKLSVFSGIFRHIIAERNVNIIRNIQDNLADYIQPVELFENHENFSGFHSDPMVCDKPNVYCKFFTPLLPVKCTFNDGRSNRPIGYIPSPNEDIACGNFITNGTLQNYKFGPSICCSPIERNNIKKCPKEASKLLNREYLERKNNHPEMFSSLNYCIGLQSIREKISNKDTKKRRKKRTFFEYLKSGYFLSNAYIDQKTFESRSIADKKISELRNQFQENNENIVHKITELESNTQIAINNVMCTTAYNQWSETIDRKIGQFALEIKSEILENLESCNEQNVPISIPHKTLIKICIAVTEKQHEILCKKHASLFFTCENKSLFIENDKINHIVTLRLKIPVTGDINTYLIYPMAIPIKGLDGAIQKLNITRENPKNFDLQEDQDKNKKILEILATQNSILQKYLMEEPLSPGNYPGNYPEKELNIHLYRYAKLNIEKSIVFMPNKTTTFNQILSFEFEKCVKKGSYNICSVGSGETSNKLCQYALIFRIPSVIKTECQYNVINGPNCLIHTFDNHYIIGTYTKISIFDNEVEKNIFSTKPETYCNANTVCIIEPKPNRTLNFRCNNLNYALIENKEKNISIEIQNTPEDIQQYNLESHWKNTKFTNLENFHSSLNFNGFSLKQKLVNILVIIILLIIITAILVVVAKIAYAKYKRCTRTPTAEMTEMVPINNN